MRSTVSQSDVFSLMPITKPHLRPRYSYTDGPPKRRIDADASLTRSWHELNLLRDEVHLPPGENNHNAVPGGKLCFEYMNKGRYILERTCNIDANEWRQAESVVSATWFRVIRKLLQIGIVVACSRKKKL